MHAETTGRRVWIAGRAIDVWEHPEVHFSWTQTAIQGYITAGRWESVFNALVLLGDSDPKGMA